jgi:hypothetical protein
VAAGALDQAEVEDALYGAAEHNRLVADDGPHRCWATIRSGLSAGLQQPVDLDADDRPNMGRRATSKPRVGKLIDVVTRLAGYFAVPPDRRREPH